MSKTLRILLIAGHGAGDPGAVGYGTEATETRRVLNEVKALFGGYDVTVDVYPTNRNAYADIGNGSLQVNFANYDYVFEIHFNSAANPESTGVEIWVTYAEQGITVEQAIANKVAALGYSNRGVKREDFRVIRTARNKGTSAALIETCFISNQGDMNRYNGNFTKVCNAMVEGIAEGFGLSKKDGYVKPTPQPPQNTENPKINYYVKTSSGKQLGAFNNLAYAKDMASKNKAIVFDKNGNVVVSYITSNKKYLNLNPHVASWRVYPTNVAPIIKNASGSLAPKQFGGLSYEILGNPQADVYTIQTQSFGRVNIYAPRDNDSSITNNPIY